MKPELGKAILFSYKFNGKYEIQLYRSVPTFD